MNPIRVQLSRAKGWRMLPNTVNVARPGPWGNPYRVGERVDLRQANRWCWKIKHPERAPEDARQAVKWFYASLAFDDASIMLIRRDLAGKNLACWCKAGEPCHADVLLRIANDTPSAGRKP